MTRCVLLLAWTILAGACASLGPKSVPRDQFDYNAAIAESTQEQLLLNLVRLRYSETPVFLKVSSVISQYSRSASANAGIGANTAFTGDNTAAAGGSLTWTDKPTITYTPISGSEFSRNLLNPLPPGALFEMMQSGMPVELVLPITAWSINGVENDVAQPSRRRQADAEMYEMFDLLGRLRESRGLGIRKTMTEDDKEEVFLFIARKPDTAETNGDVARFRELLGIEPSVREFRLIYGLVPEKPGDIAVLTGSVWDIMQNLAWQFDAPADHIESGRTDVGFLSERSKFHGPFQVRFSKDEPKSAFVAVHLHDHWFFIDQRDRHSKRVFSFLQILLNLAETEPKAKGPLIALAD